jgi:hypothetical protein
MEPHFDIPEGRLCALLQQHKEWGPVKLPVSLQNGLTPDQERDLMLILEDRRVTDLSAQFWQKRNLIDNGWLPTQENVNKLPGPLRQYIHDLETRCDPAGEVRRLVCATDTITQLSIAIAEKDENS